VWVEHHVHLSLPDFIITRCVHLDNVRLCFRWCLSNSKMLYALWFQIFVQVISF